MDSKVIRNRERLLEIVERKSRLLRSVIDQIDHIESNPVFVEEIHEAYMDLDEDEAEIMGDYDMIIECPGCGFECSQIHTFCMACGTKLTDQSGSLDA